MEKILVTGAAGSLGEQVIELLLKQKTYEITVLDLKNKESIKKLKKYMRKINVIYGNIEDQILMDALIKEHDFIIHLAGIMPPLSNLSKVFYEEIDYKGLENIIRSISFYNPKCTLIFPSTTTIYEKNKKEISINSSIKYNEEDYYSENKEKCEKLIKEKLKNYIIFRIPFLLEEIAKEQPIYLYKQNQEVELLTSSDAAYALVKSIQCKNALNKKTKILSGGKGCRINTNKLLIKLLDVYGYPFSLFWRKTYFYDGHIFKEDKKLLELLNYQTDSIESYFVRIKRTKPIKRQHRFYAKVLKRKLEKKWLQ